jgi:hypothetical protein
MKGLFGGLLLLLGILKKVDGQLPVLTQAGCMLILSTVTPRDIDMCRNGCQYEQMNSPYMRMKCLCITVYTPRAMLC